MQWDTRGRSGHVPRYLGVWEGSLEDVASEQSPKAGKVCLVEGMVQTPGSGGEVGDVRG